MPKKKRMTVNDIPAHHLECRGNMHPWRKMPSVEITARYADLTLNWICPDCGAIWVKGYDMRTLSRVYSRVVYPPDWVRIPKNGTRPGIPKAEIEIAALLVNNKSVVRNARRRSARSSN